MSFTTNGNMHRHARIHTKEENMNALSGSQANKFQIRRNKTAWRQRLGQYLTQSNSPVADHIKPLSSQEILQTLPNHSQRSLFGRPTENLPSMVPNLKRQYSNGPDSGSDWSIPFKRQSLENNNDIYKTYNYTLNTSDEEQHLQIKKEVVSYGSVSLLVVKGPQPFITGSPVVTTLTLYNTILTLNTSVKEAL